MGDPAPGKACASGGSVPNHAILDPSGGMTKDPMDLQYDFLSAQVRDGAYPLHIAVQSRAPPVVLELLIRHAPEVLAMTNKFGETPLHLALQHGPVGREAAELLLRHGPEAVRARDRGGDLPLHHAACHGAAADVVRRVVEIWPEVIHEVNKEGLTPMACAIQHGHCDKEVLDLLSIKDFRTVTPTECM